MTRIKINTDGNKTVTLTNENNTALEVTGFDPSDLLAGALAKCTENEVRRFAAGKAYDLKKLEVRVDLDRDGETKTANFKVHLDVEGELSDAELRQLHKTAGKSYINRLLSNNIALSGDIHHNGHVVNFE